MPINITQFPREIKSIIFSFLDPTVSNLIKYHVVCENLRENVERIRLSAALRIQLAYKIIKESKFQDKKILFQLNKMFKNGPPICCISKGTCVYYAPVVPNGMCRFCTGRQSDHKIPERLILKHYIPRIVPLYSDY